MSNFKCITLAMDLSMSSPGFAAIALHDGKPIVLETSVIKTNPKSTHGERLVEIVVELEDLMHKYKPANLVREKGFSRFPQVTQTLFKVVGVVDMCAYTDLGLEVHEIAVTSVKKAVTDNGKATKEEVADKVFQLYQIDNTEEYFTPKGKLIDDKTDALAVGYAFYKHNKLV